jgi:hypothetical protein
MNVNTGAPMRLTLIVLGIAAALLFVWGLCCAARRADDASERYAKERGING